MLDLASAEVLRHKAAIRRDALSLPMKCVLRDRLFYPAHAVFDYGCGLGGDIVRLRELGINCDGWDPAWKPKVPKIAAEIVNLGYVINVIENPSERAATLREAWNLAQRILVVAARILVGGRGSAAVQYGDGVVTQLGTFQKFYSQAELRDYIESTLGIVPQPAAPGVFYVFRDDGLRQQFLANRYRRRSAAPQRRLSEVRFDSHREILGFPGFEWVAGGSAPRPPKFCRHDSGVQRRTLEDWLPRSGAFGAPSVRVSLAGLLFSSAPVCFPERL